MFKNIPNPMNILEPEEKTILKKGVINIIPHLMKLSIISSMLFISPIVNAANIGPHEIINQVNTTRTLHALPNLHENHLLTLAAHKKANDMIAKNYFSHLSPNGKQFHEWIDDVGYKFNYAGENLAKDFHSTESLMTAWMDSPTHKANILDTDFCEIGIASLAYHNGSPLVVQIFGCRNISSIPTSSESPQNSDKGYVISETTGVITTTSTNNTAPPKNPEQNKSSNLAVVGLSTLFGVSILTLEQRRRHYHHIYKIPVRLIMQSNQKQNDNSQNNTIPSKHSQ